MRKLKMLGVERNSGDQRLCRFFPVIFSIPDQRMAHGRKLRANLVLQSRYQLHSNKRCISEGAFHGVAKFSAGGFRITRSPQLLKHSLPAEIMDQRSCFRANAAPHHRQILSDRSVRKKLPDQRIPVTISLGEQENPRGKAVNTVHNQRALSLRLEFRNQQRQRRWRI